MVGRYRVGDRVVFTRDKHSTHPGPRAKNVSPSAHGELYAYQVDKFWTVKSVVEPGTVSVITRRGKTHSVNADDPRLRHAHWWEKLFYGKRFPNRDEVESPSQSSPLRSFPA